ncbi:hypothetical protein SAMN05428939_8112 [Streptomyces sp. TLI_105]|nr:hypothetical protein SAMN05428939_8112 [Streptomyces sp. TLI_105]
MMGRSWLVCACSLPARGWHREIGYDQELIELLPA